MRPNSLSRALVLATTLIAVAGCRVSESQDTKHVEDTSALVPSRPGETPVVLPQGTVLRCAIAEDLSISHARVGDVVTLIATERIMQDGVDIILPGTHLQARVTHVRRPRTGLQSPELTLDTVTIESPSGSLRDCPARTIHVKLQSDRHGLAAGSLLDVFLSAPIEMPPPQQI